MFQCNTLILFRPFIFCPRMISIECSRSDFRYNKRFIPRHRIVANPLHHILYAVHRRLILIAIPLRIQIERYNLRYIQADIFFMFITCRCSRTGPVKFFQLPVLFCIAVSAVQSFAGALVQDSPYKDAGMILVIHHHLSDTIFRLLLKIGILHMIFLQSSCMTLFPDQNSLLVA